MMMMMLLLTSNSSLLIALFFFSISLFSSVYSHTEDLCFGRAAPGAKGGSGVYNFYATGDENGCAYGEKTLRCLNAVGADTQDSFNDTSICRGMMHFMTIYLIATAVGFTDEVAYWFSAFSQAIDYNQYRAVDSCGRDMPKQWWTPRMRGLARLNAFDGGTARHIATPFNGVEDKAPLPEGEIKGTGPIMYQGRKTYTGNSPLGCHAVDFKQPFEWYLPNCPGLRLDLEDKYYNGLSWQGRRWGLNESRTLCVAGFTVLNSPTDSPFEGDKCLPGRVQRLVNVNLDMTLGPIPLNNYYFVTGDQQIDYDCSPDCQAANWTKTNIAYINDFEAWLKKESETHGYAKLRNGETVDPVVAKFGIYLHWLVDRISHWYCADAPQSAHIIVPDPKAPGEYDIFLYIDNSQCSFLTHMMTHYWEQGRGGQLAPSTYAALVAQYKELVNFREKFEEVRPDWFQDPLKKPMNFDKIIGDYEEPGDLFKIVQIENGAERYQAQVDWLAKNRLPPFPDSKEQC